MHREPIEQVQRCNMTKCEICGVEYKRLTQSHLKAHNITIKEYNAIYEPEKNRLKKRTSFINDYYISPRYRWLEYRGNGEPVTVDIYKNAERKKGRTYKLNDSDIKKHLNGEYTIGIYFMKEPNASKLIGLDLDIMDTDLLERIFTALFTYGIERKNILMSFSGNKGYHIDIFLDGLLDKGTIRKFYDVLLHDLSVSSHTLELRGGDGRGYKLPFGYSQKTGNYCYPCNEYGKQIDDIESDKVIDGIEKLDIQVIANAIELNDILPRINEVEAVGMEELREGVNLLDIYKGGNRIQKVERMLQEGMHNKGNRQRAIFEVAMYYRSIYGYCIKDTIEKLKRWILEKWTVGAEPETFIRNELDSIVAKVYKYGYEFSASESDLFRISEAETREIFSIKTGNKLNTDSLHKLYFAMLIHSKAFADTNGIFYMTRDQMKIMTGSNSDNKTMTKHIKQLEEMGKLEVIKPKEKYRKGTCKSNPMDFKLSVQIPNEGKQLFIECGKSAKCKDCMYVVHGCLVENKPIPEGRQCKIIEFPISIDG